MVGGSRNRSEQKVCVLCCLEEEDVEHVLLRCGDYRWERDELWRAVGV